MLQTRKRATALLAAVGVAAAIGVGGFAYAAFTQERDSEAIAAQAERFENLVVTGLPADTSLWPGQKTDVTLTIDNSANDTPIDVTRAEHVPVVVGDIVTANPAYAGYCKNQLVLEDFPRITGAAARVDANVADTIVLEDALELLGSADERCQGMTFTVKWKVSAETAYGS
ncbi:MAG TPA: hypothetical protein VFT95_19880 [Micromonosporaceae bacterium]|nr:hypothetical protein [Micromonosporaceae bacterium]